MRKITYLELDDGKLTNFLIAFKNGLDNKEIDGKVFKETDKDRSTKCKSVISDKLDICSRKSIGIKVMLQKQQKHVINMLLMSLGWMKFIQL